MSKLSGILLFHSSSVCENKQRNFLVKYLCSFQGDVSANGLDRLHEAISGSINISNHEQLPLNELPDHVMSSRHEMRGYSTGNERLNNY